MIADGWIVEVQNDPPDEISVTFSDGAAGAYLIEDLFDLGSYRERLDA